MSSAPMYEYGVSDLIRVTALVADGVVALKDGGFLAGWRYTGTDDPDQATRVRDRFAGLIGQGAGWVLETNVIRVPSTSYPAWGVFPDPVSRLIEAERMSGFTTPGRYYQSRYYMTLSWFPPSTVAERAKGWFYVKPDGKQGVAGEALEHFQSKVDEFQTLCSGFLQMERLKANGEFDDLLSYIDLCISGIDRPFLMPDSPIDLDCILGGVDLLGGTHPKLSGKPLRVLAVDPMPGAIYPGMLGFLEDLPMPFRLHGRSILLDRHEAKAVHEEKGRHHKSKITKFWSGKVMKDPSAELDEREMGLMSEAHKAAALVEAPKESQAHYSARIILIRDTEEEMREAIDAAVECAGKAHLKLRLETYNSTDAWCGSLPGHCFFDIRQVVLRNFNVAGMTPLQSLWTGYEFNPNPKMPPKSSPLLVAAAPGRTPVKFNLHVQDVGHMGIYGPTGAGKTVFTGTLAVSLLRYPNAQVVMFDRFRTMYVLCKALGGQYYDFGSDASLRLCPLQELSTQADKAWAGNFIEFICSQNGLTVTGAHTELIGKTLERFARRPANERSLTHFAGATGDLDIQKAMQLYTVGNPLSAGLLDGTEDSIMDSNLTVFEVSELMRMHPRVCMAVQMYLFRRVERKMDPSHITGVFLDEARRLVDNPVFAEYIGNLLRESRNVNGCVISVFQDIEDGGGLRSIYDQQCKTKALLPNAQIKSDRTRAAYAAVGLTESQIELVKDATEKRDYLLLTPEHFSKVTLDLGPVALAFIANSTPEQCALVDRLAARNPVSWQAEFLRYHGCSEWADWYEQSLVEVA